MRSKLFRFSIGVFGVVFLFCGSAEPKKKPQALGKNDWRYFYSTGVEFQKKGRCELAIREYRKSLDLNPEQSLVWNYLGLAQYSCKLYPESIASYKKALQINPVFTDVHNNLGILYAEMGNPEEALREFDEALADKRYRTPENVYYNKGKLLFQLQRYAEAAEALENACVLKSEMHDWCLELGLLYEKIGKDDKALETFESILKSDADNVPSLFQAAVLYMKREDKNRAKLYFSKVVRLSPDSEFGAKSKDYLKELGT
jgi:type IV pilus assembly protein PilF